MAHIVEDRILESTTTTGTGVVTLAAAVTGFRRFSAVCAIGDTVPYFIEAIDSLGQPTGDYEYGEATYSAANQITRTKVRGSSNAGAAVVFAAGTKNIGLPMTSGMGVPTGMLGEFLATTPPAGWLERDGSLISRAQYPALSQHALNGGCITASDAAWASDKRKFSPGDGSTTIRLPDHRGYHMRAWDHGAGVDTGRALASEQADAALSHTHTASVTDPGHTHVGVVGNGAIGNIPAGGSTVCPIGNVGITANTTGIGVTVNASGSAENRVKTVAVLACIKY